MKKLFLLFLILGFGAVVNAQKKPYNNLIITEARLNTPDYNYCEVTNMGTETIDLSEFKLCALRGDPWLDDYNASFVFPQVMLAPGESYVLATAWDAEPRMWAKDLHGANSERSALGYRPWIQIPEMYELADYMFEMAESSGFNVKDSITPHYEVMVQWDGFYIWYLRHIYTIDGIKDSMIIDQINGVFDDPDGYNYGRPYDVAGVKDATDLCVFIRKASVTTGITEFSSHAANDEAAKMHFNNGRGLDLGDSEWIPVPFLGVNKNDSWMRAAFWTVGNQGDYKLDANTLVPKIPGEITVDFAQATIAVPWGMGYNDSIMNHFVRKPGLAWIYEYAPTKEDSMYTSIRNGDKLTIYACGNEAMIKTFTFVVSDPTPSDNKVLSKTPFINPYPGYSYRRFSYFEVTDGIAGMDTIRGIGFATRVDTLYKYLEKAPKASWKIIPKSGITKPELSFGDKLQVTSENGTVKEYFLKLMNSVLSPNEKLAAITWPDMPPFFKGDIAELYGWKGDTIPAFTPSNGSYIVKIPLGYQGIPALVFSKEDLNSTVEVKRAKTLGGTLEDATATFTVTAQDGIAKKVYTVRFDQEKDPVNVQPFIADPYISQIQVLDRNLFPWVELANPGTEPIDLTHYMIMAGRGDIATIFNAYNLPENYNRAYSKYVPGKKWQDEASWIIQPRILEQDLATNPIVAPGDVFVMTALDLALDGDSYPGEVHWFQNTIDFNFWNTPWGTGSEIGDILAIRSTYDGVTQCLFKILNDSVVNGTKPATDINDFKLIDVVGNGQSGVPWSLAGEYDVTVKTGMTRKPNIYKGNPEFNGSFGTNRDNCEWTWVNIPILKAQGWLWWPDYIWHQLDGMGSQVMDPITIGQSTVSSLKYKVSPGYSQAETIRGIGTGTTVTDFYSNIIKADPLQTLKVKSLATGNELDGASVISNGDMLIVLSGDSINTSKYILDVSPLSSDAMLTSSVYTIEATLTGTISGFDIGTLLKTVVDNVVVPAGATLTITDQNDAYMSLKKLNYDSAYVDVIASVNVYFKVTAENGTTNIVYQLIPTSNPGDAYVTSEVYSVDQSGSLINFVPYGTTVTSFLSNVTPSKGATLNVVDKAGFVRESGNIYRDDKLVVTSEDGTTIKTYFLAMLNFYVNTYLAYVISDDYIINQISYTIAGPLSSTTLTEFYSKLYPSFGATLSVLDKDGNVSQLAHLSIGDKLLVTAADGETTAVYSIEINTTKVFDPNAATIKIYPNPTQDRVIIRGLANGNRVRVFNAAGITLRDVIVDNSTEYVSLSAQPAGIYIFVISSGDQFIDIQKIVKQ